jgi:hypothetical protein
MADALPMFPGLQLDRLTVEDCFHDKGVNDPSADYGTRSELSSLISSNGWKELHFISPTTGFLSSSDDNVSVSFAPQLADWNKTPKIRDGEDSEAEVTMYFTNTPRMAGLVENPQTGAADEVLPWELRVTAQKRPLYMRIVAEIDAREVLMVAKRGKDTWYV